MRNGFSVVLVNVFLGRFLSWLLCCRVFRLSALSLRCMMQCGALLGGVVML